MNNEQQTNLIPTNPTLRMTSLEVAELTDKNHRDVMRDIRNLLSQEAITERNFALSEYKDESGKMNPMYSLDFESTMVLITGYDAKRRSLVIKRWLALERGEAVPAFASASAINDMLLDTPVIKLLMNSQETLLACVERLTVAVGIQTGSVASPQVVLSFRPSNVPGFVKATCSTDGDSAVKKSRLYDLYRQYCHSTSTFQERYDIFFKALYRSGMPVRPAKLTVNGVRTPMVSGLRLMTEAQS